MSGRAWVYVAGVLLGGGLLSGAALAGSPPSPTQWTALAALLVAATAAHLLKVEAPSHTLYYATPAFFLAGVFALPAALFAPLVAAPHLVEWAKERWQHSDDLRAWYLQPFNIAMVIIAGDGARTMYWALAPRGGPAATPPALAAMGLAALTYIALNDLLLGLALVLGRGRSWRDSGVLRGAVLLTDLVLGCLGIVAAVLWQTSPWLLLPALAPLALIHRTLLIPHLEHEAHIDGKTGVYNARHFGALYTAEFERARRFNRPLAFIMADLDFLRDVNNTHGHLAGDAVLAGIGRVIRATARDLDVVGRFGGEEFAIMLPEAGLLEARTLAERVRQAIEAARFAVESSATPLRVTMSLGVACFPSDATTPTDLTHAADVAVYQAKAGGRNRVVCAVDVARSPLHEGVAMAGAGPASAAVAPMGSTPHCMGDEERALGGPPVAMADALTGLGTHRLFHEELRRAVMQAHLYDRAPLALALLDVDEFAAMNDQHGHGYGDDALVILAGMLRRGRADDRAFRLGGDAFALLLPRTAVGAAVGAMERLRAEAACDLRGVTVSIGVAALNAEDDDADALLDRATAALATAKRRGRNAVVTGEETADVVVITAAAQARAVRRLLTEGHMTVAFQAIWDLERGDILAFEALARSDVCYGLTGPQEAFDVAERLGRAHELDALCRQAALTRAADLPPDALLFLNVSPQTLDRGLLAGTALLEAVAAAGRSPERVVLEITERSVARPGVLAREAARLRQLGFKLALDDVGAGNAGLEVLSQVPMDFVKIDRSVVMQAAAVLSARAVLAGILAIARETGAYVIAEGIETDTLLAFVRQAGAADSASRGGIRGAQGYLLGRPSATIPDARRLDEPRALLTVA